MYYVHDRYNAASHVALATLPADVTVVDYYADQRYKLLKGVYELPCYLERLEFYDEDTARLMQQVQTLSSDLAQTKQALAKLQERQQSQESMIIECFTDLDASLNGGDSDVALE